MTSSIKPIAQNLTKLSRFGPNPAACKGFPKGFLASGVHCGIKKKLIIDAANGKPAATSSPRDLALIVSTMKETTAAGCFTKNVFKAAPVKYSIEKLQKSGGTGIQGIIINSGCANAVTGHQGSLDAAEMGKLLDEHIGVDADFSGSLVLSTGVIGQLLPMDAIRSGMKDAIAGLSVFYEGWQNAAEAFMTTDTFPKLLTHSFYLGNHEIRFAGIDKGAGMIHPAMGPPHATLLGCIATDVAIQADSLQLALTRAVDRSFNRISIDGDMSTNDTILALANGAAHNPRISHTSHSEDFAIFEKELTQFALRLAKLVVRDGEGATKFVQVRVIGAESEEGATRVAATVANSSLVKCALNGQDANWGRILCAVGYSKVEGIDPAKVSVSFKSPAGEQVNTLVNGEPQCVNESKAYEILRGEDIEILVDLGKEGGQESSYFTCDFSKEYVSINGDYRS